MTKSAEALVKPELLVWAREAARIPVEYAAAKLGVPVETLRSWECGESRPTVKRLRHMATLYRQTFAAFYLPEPPQRTQPVIRDYRLLTGTKHDELPISLHFEIRSALDRREIVLDLLREVGGSMPSFEISATLEDNPELLGESLRKALGISFAEQSRLQDRRLAFNYWRSAIESAGILVFQASDVPLEYMRGFSLSLFPLPVMVVNRHDAYAGRTFTMLHELCHILLRTSGVCDLDERLGRPSAEQRTEVFCNHFAGACLAPSRSLRSEKTVVYAQASNTWTDMDFSRLSARYGVSQEVILRRLLILGFIDETLYQTRREELLEEYEAISSKKDGWVHPATDTISKAGRPFVRLVLDAFGTGRITTSDVADYLGVRLKHLSRIQQSIGAA